MFQSHFLVDELKQLCQAAIQLQQVVFHFQAGGAEQVPDIVGGRKADRQVVGYRVLAQLLCLQQGLGEIQGQLVAGRTYGEQGGEILTVAFTPGMRERAAVAREVCLPVIVIFGDTLVGFRRL